LQSFSFYHDSRNKTGFSVFRIVGRRTTARIVNASVHMIHSHMSLFPLPPDIKSPTYLWGPWKIVKRTACTVESGKTAFGFQFIISGISVYPGPHRIEYTSIPLAWWSTPQCLHHRSTFQWNSIDTDPINLLYRYDCRLVLPICQ
jgi:hypothetical protein